MTIQKKYKKNNFTENLLNQATIFFIAEEVKETISDFWKGTIRESKVYFSLIYQYKMTWYNTLNVELSNLQLIKLKLRIKIGTEDSLNVSSNMISYSNDKTDFYINSDYC